MSKLAVTIDRQTYEVELKLAPQCGGLCEASVNGQPVRVTVPNLAGPLEQIEWLIVDGRPFELVVGDNLQWIRVWSGLHRIEIRDTEAAITRPRSGDGRIKAPIPGLITRILVAPGAPVQADQPLLVLEAMKMENEIRAPFDGVVKSIHVTSGQTVVRNEVLVEVS